MSPEEHRAILMRALADGDWQNAERATRARSWRYLFDTLRDLFARLMQR